MTSSLQQSSQSAGDASVQWLGACTRVLSSCSSERALVEAACRLAAERLGAAELVLLLVRPELELLEVAARWVNENPVQPTGEGRSFQPGSPLRSWMYGPELGPEGSGCAWAEDESPTGGWPLGPGARRALWLSLRTGPEVLGTMVIDCGERLDAAGRDVAVVAQLAQVLALHLQVLWLRSERDGRVDELGADLRRLTLDQEWLRGATASLAACRCVGDVVEAAYRSVRFALGFDRVAVFVAAAEAGKPVLRIMAGTGEKGDAYSGGLALRLDDERLQDAAPDVAHLLAGAPYFYCRDRWQTTDPLFRSRLHGRIGEQLVVAIRRGDSLAGMISVDNLLSGRPLPESRAEVLVTFAQVVGPALENARLTEAEAEARARAEALLKANQAMNRSIDTQEVMQVVARETRKALRSRTCDIFLYDDTAQAVIAHFTDGYDSVEIVERSNHSLPAKPSGDVETDEMLRTLLPMVVDCSRPASASTAPGTHLAYSSRLLIPIVSESEGVRRAKGALYVNFVGRAASDVSGDEIELAGGMAAQAASALEKARLYDIERGRARHLEEVDALRREFMATVSHELRTPLTGIIGFAETLTHYWDQMPNDRRLSSVRKMHRSAQRLDRLVRDIFLASSLEDATFSLRIGVVDACATVRHAVDEIRAKYPQQFVQTVVPPGLLPASADGERLAQVLVNLLDNAVKYSPEGFSVEIGAAAVDGMVRFWVHDQGPGISSEQIERLFGRFARLGHTPRKGMGGSGLGLYICQHLVRAMGGEITVTSAVGRGSTFEFRLAAVPTTPAA